MAVGNLHLNLLFQDGVGARKINAYAEFHDNPPNRNPLLSSGRQGDAGF